MRTSPRLVLLLAVVAAAASACTPLRDREPPALCEALPREVPDGRDDDMFAQPSRDAGYEGTSPSPTRAAPSPTRVAPSPTRVESDAYSQEVTLTPHSRVHTLLNVDWTQVRDAERVWLEVRFGEGEVLRSRPQPGREGARHDVALGIPASTTVSLRVVSSEAGSEYASREYTAATGALPSGLPLPTVFAFDPERASPERWLFGSVENSSGGSDQGYYYNTFWLYILDRQGRVVWYYADPATNATSSFQRVARDGEYLWIEKRAFNGALAPSVLKTTLDGSYSEELPVPGLSDCIDVTEDGSLLYDRNGELHELTRSGDDRAIWSCRDHFGYDFHCYTNTVNWYAGEDTVLLSFPYEDTVVEVARATGRVVGQYGRARGSYAFAPPERTPPARWSFSFQHFPNRTADGTLLVSSHVPGCAEWSEPGPRRHAFVEFEIDRASQTLRERWRYTNGREWPKAKGMAIRLANGNTLANYGTGGVIREVDPEGRTVFGVKFDSPEGSDFYNKMVGHNVLIDDLYALNGGP